MHIPPKARSIPASDRETSATLWVHGMSAYTGRPIGACVCFALRPIAMLVLASGGCASRRSYTQELHSTAPPRPDERPGQGRSSSRKCDMGYTSNIHIFIYSLSAPYLVISWSKGQSGQSGQSTVGLPASLSQRSLPPISPGSSDPSCPFIMRRRPHSGFGAILPRLLCWVPQGHARCYSSGF